MRFLTLAMLLFVMGSAAAGEMHKCTAASGKIEYRDRPCDGATAAQKIAPKDNSAGTGNDLATIRAKDAELKARMTARQDAVDRENAAIHAANERAFYADRSHQDSVDLTNAIREGNAQTNADWANSNLVRQRERKIKVEIVPMPAPKEPPKKK